jgi:hypothetical protein
VETFIKALEFLLQSRAVIELNITNMSKCKNFTSDVIENWTPIIQNNEREEN